MNTENFIIVILFILFLIAISINAILEVVKINTELKKSDMSLKVLLYLLSEISFDEKCSKNIITNLKDNNNDVVKISSICIVKNLFQKLKLTMEKSWMLSSGVFVLFIIIGFLIMRYVSLLNLYLYIGFIVSLYIVIIYSHSATLSISPYESNIKNLHYHISNFQLLKNDEVRRKLVDEVKVDFDLYKMDNSIYMLMFPFSLLIIVNYEKFELFVGESFFVPCLIIMFVWTLMNFLHKTYKANVVYIVYQSLIRYEVIDLKEGTSNIRIENNLTL
jgi:hypothetical protein